ncbi:MAG: type II toxin-antitoxin system Phd/YefM family antitoxin [Pseudonocardiaceae bacterium]
MLDRVAQGDEITITRHGQPVAVVVRPEALRTRRG